jgi:hypothetical protein
MAKYDHGGGCPCGLYKECDPGCREYKGKTNMMTMDIYSKPGTKVYFLGANGYEAELAHAMKTFLIGQHLTVKRIDVGSSISYVEFEEYPNRMFNTVMFNNVDSTPSMVTPVNGFMTTDGKIHKSEEYAVQHQKYLNVRDGIAKLLEDNLTCHDSALIARMSAHILSENKQQLYALLKKNQ